jgi:predicted Zn finger-like uncharacterized protein
MILICPACSTKYVVDPRALGARGRKVRCARCQHLWTQAPPDDGMPVGLAEPAAIERPPPPPARIQLPAVPPPARSRWRTLAWAGVGIAACLVIAAGTFWRQDLIRFAAGPEPAGAGLALANVASSPGTDGRVRIAGEIVNQTDEPRPLPRIRVGSESVAPPEKMVGPRGKVPFEIEVKRPSETTASLVVTFEKEL